MQHQKEQISSRFDHIKREAEMNIPLLNEILQKSNRHMKNLQNLNKQELLEDPTYYRDVFNFLHDGHQNLVELNLSLKKFLLKTENSTLNKIATEFESTVLKTTEIEGNASVISTVNLKLPEVESPLTVNQQSATNVASPACSIISNKEVLNSASSTNFQDDCKSNTSEGNLDSSSSCLNVHALEYIPAKVVVNRILSIKPKSIPKLNDICKVGYLDSPSHFYIQTADGHLDEITSQLSEVLINTNRTKSLMRDQVGQFYAVYIDDYYYRVEVLDWMESKEDDRYVRVQLIDYGDTFVVPYKDLKFLTPALYSFPKVAQLCHLRGLYPAGSTTKNQLTSWSTVSIIKFQELCGNLNKHSFKIKYVRYCSERHSCEVDLIRSNNPGQTISEILIKSGHAVKFLQHYQ